MSDLEPLPQFLKHPAFLLLLLKSCFCSQGTKILNAKSKGPFFPWVFLPSLRGQLITVLALSFWVHSTSLTGLFSASLLLLLALVRVLLFVWQTHFLLTNSAKLNQIWFSSHPLWACLLPPLLHYLFSPHSLSSYTGLFAPHHPNLKASTHPVLHDFCRPRPQDWKLHENRDARWSCSPCVPRALSKVCPYLALTKYVSPEHRSLAHVSHYYLKSNRLKKGVSTPIINLLHPRHQILLILFKKSSLPLSHCHQLSFYHCLKPKRRLEFLTWSSQLCSLLSWCWRINRYRKHRWYTLSPVAWRLQQRCKSLPPSILGPMLPGSTLTHLVLPSISPWHVPSIVHQPVSLTG